MSNHSISRERLEAPPGPVYAETILEPSYRFMLQHYFGPLVETNRAWVLMLVQTGIVEALVGDRLLDALGELDRAGPEALGPFDPRYEYFYSHMERWLIDRVGEDLAGEINIGRTRPEPLTRMVLRGRLLDLVEELAGFEETLLGLAEREVATVMPQWTHFQHAQLSTLGHYLVAIVNALERDTGRLLAAYAATNQCTLGCGALAGTSYDINRDLVADLLGFDGVRENTIDAVAGGDYLLEATAAVANMMVTLSRFCQDLYAWSTEEFGFLTVADEFAGSSSMMPQKRNAYPYEYVRARAAHAIGDATAAFGTLHNTNYQDIKDVEEGMVPPAFRSLEEASRSLRLLGGTVSTMAVHRERMLERAGTGFAAATELAAMIHRQTAHSARTAHRVVGRMVLLASRAGRTGQQVDLALVNQAAHDVLGHELEGLDEAAVRRAMGPGAFVEAHAVPGGPARDRVEQAIRSARERVAGALSAARAHRTRLEDAHRELTGRCKPRR